MLRAGVGATVSDPEGLTPPGATIDAYLQIVQPPIELNVGADYGMIVLKHSLAPTADLARFLLGEARQAILTTHGFGRGDPPT